MPFVIAIILSSGAVFFLGTREHWSKPPRKSGLFLLTNPPFYLGLEGPCLGLPRVIFSPLGGAIVDRTDRKTLFVVTQTAFLLMALFLGVMDYLGTIHVWHVLAISPAGFGSSIILFAASHHFFLSLFFLFVAGGFQTTFLSSVATLLQIQSAETNRGRMMSLFGLINRGLGPIGSFPFGLIAAAIGASWTVAICGFITVGLICLHHLLTIRLA